MFTGDTLNVLQETLCWQMGHHTAASENTCKINMTSKKQIVVRDQQVKAVEVALEAMDPLINDQFHTGILRLIIDFAQPYSKFRSHRLQYHS